jgi:hypothetical protein
MPTEAQETKPYIKNLKKGEKAPFEGILIEPWGLTEIMSKLEFQEKEFKLQLEYEKKILSKDYELQLKNLEIDLETEIEFNQELTKNREKYINFIESKMVDPNPLSGYEVMLGYAAGIVTTIAIVWGLNSL